MYLYKLPPEAQRNILGPDKNVNHCDFGILSGDLCPSYYFEFRGSVYYHSPASCSVSMHCSGATDKKLLNSDPKTFQIIDKNFAKDKKQVYYWGGVVEKADPLTFQQLDWPFGKDKNYIFSGTEIVEKLKPESEYSESEKECREYAEENAAKLKYFYENKNYYERCMKVVDVFNKLKENEWYKITTDQDQIYQGPVSRFTDNSITLSDYYEFKEKFFETRIPERYFERSNNEDLTLETKIIKKIEILDNTKELRQLKMANAEVMKSIDPKIFVVLPRELILRINGVK
jgi:hypothetical protein